MKFQISSKKIARIFILPIILALLMVLPLLSQIGNEPVRNPFFAVLLLIIFIALLLVPNIYLLFHYYKNSNHIKVLFDDDSIVCYENTDLINKFLFSDIERIHFVEFDNASFPSLNKFNYIRFLSKDGETIILTSIMYDGYLYDVLFLFKCPVKFIHKGFCTVDLNFEQKSKNNEYKSNIFEAAKLNR